MRTGMPVIAREVPRLQDLTGAERPEAWVADAVERCVALCRRVAPRHAAHARRAHRVRDAVDDVLVLAARRHVPLRRRVLRPLPGATLPAAARAFNALDRADRRALLAMALRSDGRASHESPVQAQAQAQAGARGEHLASALARLVEGTLAHESRAACAGLAARIRSGKEARPPP